VSWVIPHCYTLTQQCPLSHLLNPTAVSYFHRHDDVSLPISRCWPIHTLDDLPPASNATCLGLQPYTLGSLIHKKCMSSATVSTSELLKEHGVIFKITSGTFDIIRNLGLNYVQG